MSVPGKFVVNDDAKYLGRLHDVQGVVSDGEGWGLGGGGGGVELHHHCFVAVESDVIGGCPCEEVV